MSKAIKQNPVLWKSVVAQVKSEEIGGTRANQWSARKAQIAVKLYKSKGGTYIGPKSKSNSLVRWDNQKWTTKSGIPSHISGERYLPEKAIRSLSSKDYSRVSALKRNSMRKGQQYSRMPRDIANSLRKFRK